MNIITAEVCLKYVHMLVEIPPKMGISSFMEFLKEKSSVMIYELVLFFIGRKLYFF